MNTWMKPLDGSICLIISLLLACLLPQGCAAPGATRGSTGPRVRPEIIVLTHQQADALGRQGAGEAGQGGLQGDRRLTGTRGTRTEEKGGKEQLLRAPLIRCYRIGRYKDPADPRLLHEAHTIYRIEEDGDWELTSPKEETPVTQTP